MRRFGQSVQAAASAQVVQQQGWQGVKAWVHRAL
jgi:hypothetical protein